MRPEERADFLAWLNRLSIDQLKEVASHVNGVITFKRGAVLRYLAPGSQIVYINDEARDQVGTVVKLHRVSVLVENLNGLRTRVDVDKILGLHTGGGEYSPLESASPTPFEGAGSPQPSAPVVEGVLVPHTPPAGCRWCGEKGTIDRPLIAGPGGELFHADCLEDAFTSEKEA